MCIGNGCSYVVGTSGRCSTIFSIDGSPSSTRSYWRVSRGVRTSSSYVSRNRTGSTVKTRHGSSFRSNSTRRRPLSGSSKVGSCSTCSRSSSTYRFILG